MTQLIYKWLTLCFFILHTFIVSAQDTIVSKYSNLVTTDKIKKHLSVLASDSLEGRETSKAGMVKATRYVADQYTRFGIPASNNNSYFQQIPLADYSESKSNFTTGASTYTEGKDYFIADAASSVSVSADEIVFVGYGI